MIVGGRLDRPTLDAKVNAQRSIAEEGDNEMPTSLRIFPFHFILSVSLFLLTACANQHFRVPAGGPPSGAPQAVELLREKQVANLHFPAGVYSFYAEDDKGFYYQSPRPIVQHGAGSSSWRQGGLFVNRVIPRSFAAMFFWRGRSRTWATFRECRISFGGSGGSGGSGTLRR